MHTLLSYLRHCLNVNMKFCNTGTAGNSCYGRESSLTLSLRVVQKKRLATTFKENCSAMG